MPIRTWIKPNAYYDSVTLMAVTRQISDLPGVSTCMVAMGTAMNQELLANIGLLTPEAKAVTAADLIIAAEAESEAALDAAHTAVEELLHRRGAARATAAGHSAPRSISSAVKAAPETNLAIVSVPGVFAAREARLALENGLHVMLYSDNVSLADELALKQLAHAKGLLMMGPDCGTCIIGGVGLGFANRVRRGPIGVVAASGTGAQEISTLIDRLGSGISELIGTGGRDLSETIGGLMMLDGIAALQGDPHTEVIVVVSKPPAPVVAAQVVNRLAAGAKPYVLCLLNAPDALSIDQAAIRAVALATGTPEETLAERLGHDKPLEPVQYSFGRRFVRGLYSGGTLCDQALLVLEERIGPVTCNIHHDPRHRGGAKRSEGHTLVDLGDDEFTVGRPHPMIDPSMRIQRLLEEAQDDAVAVILLDVVLGHGSHSDPAGALAGAISSVVGKGIAVVASVTGTESDPQRYGDQVTKLVAAGAVVASTARLAALTAAAAVEGRS